MARHLWGAIKLVESDRCFAHCRYRMWAITLVDQTSKTIVGRCIFIQFFDALSSHSSMAYVFFRLLCGNNSRNNMLDKQTIILNWRFLLSSDCRRSYTLHFNLMLKVLGTDTHKLTAALMHTKSVSLSLSFFPISNDYPFIPQNPAVVRLCTTFSSILPNLIRGSLLLLDTYTTWLLSERLIRFECVLGSFWLLFIFIKKSSLRFDSSAHFSACRIVVFGVVKIAGNIAEFHPTILANFDKPIHFLILILSLSLPSCSYTQFTLSVHSRSLCALQPSLYLLCRTLMMMSGSVPFFFAFQFSFEFFFSALHPLHFLLLLLPCKCSGVNSMFCAVLCTVLWVFPSFRFNCCG